MSVNKVILVGNVGKDPEIKYFDNDNVKANFPLATSERGYTAANGPKYPKEQNGTTLFVGEDLHKS